MSPLANQRVTGGNHCQDPAVESLSGGGGRRPASVARGLLGQGGRGVAGSPYKRLYARDRRLVELRELGCERDRRGARVSSTRSTRPIASASSASTRRPVRQRSSARLRPTSVGRPQAATASPWPGPRAGQPGAGRGHAHVAADRELQAAADRGPVERGEHRARQLEDAGVELVQRIAHPRALGVADRRVGAAAEPPGPRGAEHDHVLALRLDRGVQRLDERAVERVVALRAVEQEPGDSGVRVVDEQRHRARSLGFRRGGPGIAWIYDAAAAGVPARGRADRVVHRGRLAAARLAAHAVAADPGAGGGARRAAAGPLARQRRADARRQGARRRRARGRHLRAARARRRPPRPAARRPSC